MTLYTLSYTLHGNEDELYYLPTKKAALEYLKEEKERHGKSNITETNISSFDFKLTKKDIASPVSYTHLTLPTTPYV